MIPTVISCYVTQAEKLKASCHQLNIPIEMECSSALQPEFILKKLRELNTPVLWVEPTAQLMKVPHAECLEECDFSVRVEEFLPKTHQARVLTHTVFARPTAEVMQLMQEWIVECKKGNPAALRDALARHPQLCFRALPLSFSKIFHCDGLFISKDEVIVEHEEPSYGFRREVHETCCHHRSH